MNIILTCTFICASFAFTFTNFFYDEDDWFVIKHPGEIQCFTDDYYRVIVGSSNGIFSIDKVSKELVYDASLVRGLPSENIKNILFDTSTNYIWIVHEFGVSYKSISSFSYSNLSFSDLYEKGLSSIDDIGVSSSYVWLRKSNYIVPVNPFTGSFVDISSVGNEMDEIRWQSSMYGYGGQEIDISRYYSSNPDWTIGYRYEKTNNKHIDFNVFFDKHGNQIIPTVKFIDSDRNFWVGTDKGFLYYAWGNSSKLELIDPGLKRGVVSGAKIDEDNNWWIYDSSYKRTGILKRDPLAIIDDDVFLTFWNEAEGIWKKFTLDRSNNVQSVDVNDFLKIDNYIFLATMNGLYRTDVNTINNMNVSGPYVGSNWEIVDVSDGLLDKAVWKVVKYDDVLFALTSNGINEIDIKTFSVVPSRLIKFKNIDTYDMIVNNENIILSTVNGIASINLSDLSESFIHLSTCNQIQVEEDYLYCLDRGIVRFDLNKPNSNPDILLLDSSVRSFTISSNHMWANLVSKVRLINLHNGESWYYVNADGIVGDEIFNIGCQEDWVWFIADKGISIYNWKKYHEK